MKSVIYQGIYRLKNRAEWTPRTSISFASSHLRCSYRPSTFHLAIKRQYCIQNEQNYKDVKMEDRITDENQVRQSNSTFSIHDKEPRPIKSQEFKRDINSKKKSKLNERLGSWYTPALRQKALKEMLEERTLNERHATPTSKSISWPSNEGERLILNIVADQIGQLSPAEFAESILPYWELQDIYTKALSTPFELKLPTQTRWR